MRKVLLTGFEPFDRESVNPSWQAARELEGWRYEDAVVHTREMPCVFGTVLAALRGAIAQVQPDLVVCVGQAGGRGDMALERVAINIDDGHIADNAGCQPVERRIVEDAPDAYFSTLPIKAVVRELHAKGIAASVSCSAGTFVCNHLFFGLMHLLQSLPGPRRRPRGGFIHVPYLPEQAARDPALPSMRLETMTEGLRTAVAASLLAEGKNA